MKRFLFTILCSLLIFSCSSKVDFSELPEDIFEESSYELVFMDDFSKPELDSTKWEKCPEWQRQDVGGFWNNGCSYIEDEKLVIECKKDGSKLISGAIRSKNKFEQAGGMYKIKFKADKDNGLWYAFWLMCDAQHNVGNGAVDGAEIDIFEIISNDNGRQYLNSAVHWDGYDGNHKSNGNKFKISDDFFNEWHEVVFYWTKSGYKAFLDGKLYWDANGKDYGGTNTKPCYLKITAEYGKWNGAVDSNFVSSKMYVDYVKVYKQKKAE